MNENKTTQYRTAKTWQLVLAPAASCIPTVFIVLMTFASYLAGGVYGIATVLAGTIISGSRVFDAITDPVIALICDRFDSKYGRSRIFSTVGWVIMVFGVFGMFNLRLGSGKGVLSIVCFALLYMVYIIGYTIFGIGSNLVQVNMTNDPKQRPFMATFQTVYTTVLSSSISIILAATLMPKHNYQIGMPLLEDLSIFVIGTSFVMLMITNITVTIAKADTPEHYVNVKKEKVNMKDVWDILVHNRPLQMYIIAAASDKLALTTASQSAITVMIFGIILGNYSFNSELTFINLIVTLILLLFFVSRFAGKSGLKKATVQWTAIAIVIYGAMWIFLLCTDTLKITVNPVLKVIFIVLFCGMGAAKMAVSAVSNPLRFDIVDYEFSRTGRYMPATVMAVHSFLDKLISSLATTIVALAVASIGYTEGMPQATDALTGPIFAIGTFLWLGMPILGYICTLIAMRWYKLDKKAMEEISRKNAEMRAAQKKAE